MKFNAILKRIPVALVIMLGSMLYAQSSNAIQYFYDDLSRLVKVVDQSGNVATYTYDAVGNILSIARSTLPANNGLAILSFAPQSGFVGQSVTIEGQGFSTTQGGNAVRFNGAPVTVSAASATSLTVTVPQGATTGPISVTVAGLTVNSESNFMVVPPALLSISVAPQNFSILKLVRQFQATGTFSDGSSKDLTTTVTWNCANPSVATVSNASGSQGLATALAAGFATITATLGSTIGSSQVTSIGLSSIEIFPATRTIAPGTKQQFTLFGAFTDGTSQNLTDLFAWSSSNPAVATVSNPESGRVFVTAVGNGNTAITATLGAITESASLTVGSVTSAVLPRFAFIANTDGTISLNTVNPATGQLRSDGYAFIPGTDPKAVAVDPAGKFVYVADHGNRNLYAFTIAPNGTLVPVAGSPVTTGADPWAIAVDPFGRFVYVANRGSNSVSAYRIDASTGVLTPTPNSPFVGGSGGPSENPQALTVDPAGKFVFVAETGLDKVAVYAIDQQTGDLVEIAASPFGTGSGPVSIVAAPQGKFLYALSESFGSVSAFTVDQTSGVLTAINGSPFAASDRLLAFSMDVDPAGKFLYVASENPAGIYAFSIDPANGALNTLSGSPFPAAHSPSAITVDPSGSYAYVVIDSSHDKSVLVYGIDSTTGGLTNLGSIAERAPNAEVNGAVVAITKGTAAITYTPQFAYVSNTGPPNGSNDLSGYAINPTTGELTPVAGAPFAEGFSPQSLVADFLSPFLYASNTCSDSACLATAGSLSAFRIDPNVGSLTSVLGSPFIAGNNPLGEVVDPSGRFAYVVNNRDNNISAYAIDAVSGSLTQIPGSPFAVTQGPVSVTIDPTGLFLYVLSSCPDVSCTTGSVSVFTISTATGGLVSVGTLAVGNVPQSIVIDPTGRFAYVINKGDASVSAFAIDRTTGMWNPIAGSPFLTGQKPSSFTVDASGKFAYVTNSGANNVSAYSLDSTSGALAAVPGSPFTGVANPVAVTADISGGFLYVVNQNSNSVSAFAIDPASGALTPVAGSPFGTGTNPTTVTTTGKIQ